MFISGYSTTVSASALIRIYPPKRVGHDGRMLKNASEAQHVHQAEDVGSIPITRSETSLPTAICAKSWKTKPL